MLAYCHQLWFAWKIVLLQYRKQPILKCLLRNSCCDLLEKSYFCSIANNPFVKLFTIERVVICLKNRTFAVSQTTGHRRFFPIVVLWFAWKIVLLQYRKQHNYRMQENNSGCDLLEKSYFCSIANNLESIKFVEEEVVICLKNRTFAVSQTTQVGLLMPISLLWFAWKIVLLQYRKQPGLENIYLTVRCDLLEKSYFCSIANNELIQNKINIRVVICLKNRTFAVSQTTNTSENALILRLWFAWKIVLLQYRKQLKTEELVKKYGCDLLEKSYFCSIANNEGRRKQIEVVVVICLKNRTFAVSQTTYCQ